MQEPRIRTYEAMFLFDAGWASANLEAAYAVVKRILERANAEILYCKKWDERKLAYEVAGHKRGLYILTYFNARTDTIARIERDAQLSEEILRVLIIRAEKEAIPSEPEQQPVAEEAPTAGREDRSSPAATEPQQPQQQPQVSQAVDAAPQQGQVEQSPEHSEPAQQQPQQPAP